MIFEVVSRIERPEIIISENRVSPPEILEIIFKKLLVVPGCSFRKLKASTIQSRHVTFGTTNQFVHETSLNYKVRFITM